MRRRPWSRPLELGCIVVAVKALLDGWHEGLAAATGALPMSLAITAILCLCWTAINMVREARAQRPS